MSITPHQVHKIASLAKLSISQEDALKLGKQLDEILELTETMNSVDTSHIPPAGHASGAFLPLREDVVTQENKREDFRKIAPKVMPGSDLYLVPKVIE